MEGSLYYSRYVTACHRLRVVTSLLRTLFTLANQINSYFVPPRRAMERLATNWPVG